MADREARGERAATRTATGRRLVRGWREVKGWVWVLFWCSGGLGLLTGIPHLLHSSPPPAGVLVSGDSVTGNYNIQGTGAQRDVEISGDHDSITLRGDARNLSVSGDDNTVTVLGSVEGVTVDQDNNTVYWTKETPGKIIQPVVNGDDNKVGLSTP